MLNDSSLVPHMVNDVLLGSRRHPNHPGNVFLRTIIEAFVERYAVADKSSDRISSDGKIIHSKAHIIETVCGLVKSRGSRLMVFKDGVWVERGDEEYLRTYVSQRLAKRVRDRSREQGTSASNNDDETDLLRAVDIIISNERDEEMENLFQDAPPEEEADGENQPRACENASFPTTSASTGANGLDVILQAMVQQAGAVNQPTVLENTSSLPTSSVGDHTASNDCDFDRQETAEATRLYFLLPGAKMQDLKVECDTRHLHVSCNGKYCNYSRCFLMEIHHDLASVKARMETGTLTITVPKIRSTGETFYQEDVVMATN